MLASAQTFLWESFDAGQMPPQGWTLNGLEAQWTANNSNNAVIKLCASCWNLPVHKPDRGDP